MLSLFRTNQLIFGVLLFAYAALLRLSWFLVAPAQLPKEAGVGNQWLQGLIGGNLLSSWFLGIGILTATGLLINSIVARHRLLPGSLFPGAFYILVSSLLPFFLPYSGYWVANLFVVMAIGMVLNAFRLPSAADIIFNAGFFLGLAVLFKPSYIWLGVTLGIAITTLRSRRVREQVTLWLGMLMPLYFAGFAYYWNDQWSAFWQEQWQGVWQLPYFPALTLWQWIFTAVFALILLYIVGNRGAYLQKNTMEVQQKTNVLYWLLMGALLTFLCDAPWHPYQWQAVAPVCGTLLGFSFYKMDRRYAELLHLLLLLLLFCLHFSGWLPALS